MEPGHAVAAIDHNRADDRPTGRRFSAPATTVYVLMHAGCLGILWTGVTGEAVAILVIAFFLRAFGVSVVYHRYFAHRAFRTSRAVQFLLGVYGTVTVMGGLLWWAQTHRLHHRTADTPHDIHSPRYQGFFYSHCGWFLAAPNRSVDLSQVPDLARFPELVWLERYDIVFKVAYIAACCAWFGVVGVVWGFFLPTIIVLHMVHCIQSVSHNVGGYRRYPTRDNSRNHWLFGVLSLGEGFHHNHHCFPGSARIGLQWWEFDLGYWVLALAARCGIVWNVRAAVAGAASALADRHAETARNEIRDLGCRLDRALLAAVEAGELRGQSGIDSARAFITAHTRLLEVECRSLLIRGGFALQEAIGEFHAAARRDLAVMWAQDERSDWTAVAARLEGAFEAFAQDVQWTPGKRAQTRAQRH